MRQISISEHEAGQRLDRLLAKLFSQAGKGFLYKMLRKKNIVLNGKRAEGNEALKQGDVITVYFSEETYEKLSAGSAKEEAEQKKPVRKLFPKVVYEDKNVLILHKPAGMLSQKAEEADDSLVDYVQDYLLESVRVSVIVLTAIQRAW